MQGVASSSYSGTGVIGPSVKMVAGVTVRALDSLPLPVLLVVFVVCVAVLQWPLPQSSPLLPSFSPPSSDKDRLSPSPLLDKSYANPSTMYAQLQVYSLTSASSTGGQVPSATGQGSIAVPWSLSKGRVGRKGSSGAGLRGWRSGLGVLQEVEGEMVALQV